MSKPEAKLKKFSDVAKTFFFLMYEETSTTRMELGNDGMRDWEAVTGIGKKRWISNSLVATQRTSYAFHNL